LGREEGPWLSRCGAEGGDRRCVNDRDKGRVDERGRPEVSSRFTEKMKGIGSDSVRCYVSTLKVGKGDGEAQEKK